MADPPSRQTLELLLVALDSVHSHLASEEDTWVYLGDIPPSIAKFIVNSTKKGEWTCLIESYRFLVVCHLDILTNGQEKRIADKSEVVAFRRGLIAGTQLTGVIVYKELANYCDCDCQGCFNQILRRALILLTLCIPLCIPRAKQAVWVPKDILILLKTYM